MQREFAIYIIPKSKIGDTLKTFFATSKSRYGNNGAHNYFPHATLTGFFYDTAPEKYVSILSSLLRSSIKFNIDIVNFQYGGPGNWMGINLVCVEIVELIKEFKRLCGNDAIRVEEWLHASLAYGYQPQYSENLRDLCLEIVDLKADVGWEVVFFERMDASVGDEGVEGLVVVAGKSWKVLFSQTIESGNVRVSQKKESLKFHQRLFRFWK